jgi:hypothetical protein
LLGTHISLIFCQIQVFLNAFWSFWSSLLIPCFSQWIIHLAFLLIQLDIPICLLDFISSGHDYVKIHLILLQTRFPRLSPAAKRYDRYRRHHRTRHWQHRRHHRLCSHCRHIKNFPFDGWALIPPPAPNIYHQISALQVNKFISLHNPSQIVEFEKIFPVQHNISHGVVTIPLSLVSTCNDVHCFSSSAIKSCLVVDSGVSVCISPHKRFHCIWQKQNENSRPLLLKQCCG